MSVLPGARLRSVTSTCEVVVVRAPKRAGALMCAGAEMSPKPVETGARVAGEGSLIAVGKRYCADDLGIEVLCVSPGAGPLMFDGIELEQKSAKPLPASD